MDIEPLNRNAQLAGVAKTSASRDLGRFGHVGICSNDHGILATQLKCHTNQTLTALRRNDAAYSS